MNEQHPCTIIRVDEYSALVNSIDVKNLLIDELKISMETTGGDSYWINGNNERHNRSTQNMVISGLLDSNQHENKWWCTAETSAEVHRFKINSALDNILYHFFGMVKILASMNLEHFDFIYTPYPKRLDDRTQEG